MSKDDVNTTEGASENAEAQEGTLAEQQVLRVNVTLPDSIVIPLNHIGLEDNAEYLRSLLQEYRESAHLTSYHFEVASSKVCVNEFADLAVYLPEDAEELVLELALVLDNYTVKRIREQVNRVKEMIKFPLMTLNSVEATSSNKADTDAEAGEIAVENKDSNSKNKNKKDVKEKEEEAALAKEAVAKSDAQEKLVNQIMYDEHKGLSSFYLELLFQTGRTDMTSLPQTHISKDQKEKELNDISISGGSGSIRISVPADIIKGVTENCWSPPPPPRQMQGDLLYLEIITASEGVMHVTATAQGFFLNMSSRNNFNARPHPSNPSFSHSLLETLKQASPNLRSACNAQDRQRFFEKDSSNANANSQDALPLDAFATLYSQGRGDEAAQELQWCAPPSSVCPVMPGTSTATPDMSTNNSNSDSATAFGVEETGPPRDWNDLLQAARAIPSEEQSSRLMQSKIVAKTLWEFQIACKAAVIGILEGSIAPFNPTDIEKKHVYLYNGIFFSSAVDTEDTFKMCQGEVACRKYAGHDLKNQKRLQSFSIDGLHTVIQMLVDFKGVRMVAQTVIPGILSSGPNTSRLMLGAVEQGKRLRCKKEALVILQSLAIKCRLAQRNLDAIPVPQTEEAAAAAKIALEQEALMSKLGAMEGFDEPGPPVRVDDEDEAADIDSPTIPHIGPVEGKLIKGSDGRIYALEMFRLTPRDANYVPKSIGGTGKYESLESDVDIDVASAYLLRDELVQSFLERKRESKKKEILSTYAEEDKKRNGALRVKLEKLDSDSNQDNQDKESPEAMEALKVHSKESQIAQQELIKEIGEITEENVAPNFSLNVNVFLPFQCDSDKTVADADEDLARELATYLWDEVTPIVTKMIRKGDQAPMDCASASTLLKDFGINMRYLGRMARLAREEERTDYATAQASSMNVHSMPTFWRDLIETEIIARSTKIYLNSLFESNGKAMGSCPGPTIAAVLSALLAGNSNDTETTDKGKGASTLLPVPPTATTTGANANANTGDVSNKKKKSKSKGKGKNNNKGQSGTGTNYNGLDTVNVGGEFVLPTLFNAINNAVDVATGIDSIMKSRFGYSFADIRSTVKSDYITSGGEMTDTNNTKKEGEKDYGDEIESQNLLGNRLSRVMLLRRICQQGGIRISTRDFTFTGPVTSTSSVLAEDIIQLVPRTKTCEQEVPISDLPVLLEKSQRSLKDRDVISAYHSAQEALHLINQITGGAHKLAAQAQENMANVLHYTGDSAVALVFRQKNLLTWVQLHGLDSSEAIMEHINIASLHMEVGSIKEALPHLLSARYGLSLIGGSTHPLMTTLVQKIAEYLAVQPEASKDVYKLLFKARSMSNSLVHKAYIGTMVAGMLRSMGHIQAAIDELKQSHSLMSQIFGSEDERTLEVKEQVRAYTREITEVKVAHARAEQDRVQELRQMAVKEAEASKKSADAKKRYKEMVNQKKRR